MVVYQTKSGKIVLKPDVKGQTIWASLNQIADLFERDKSVISRHIKNIFKSGELNRESTVAKIATVQKEGNRKVVRNIEYFNLDVILSVGYRVDSKRATQFRIWATKVLKRYITQGYAIDKKRIALNYEKFIQAVSDIKALLPYNSKIDTKQILELVKTFANTWVSLDAYDRGMLPKQGSTRKQVEITAKQLENAIGKLKNELIKKKQASDLFAKERSDDAIKGILGNVFQSAFGQEMYPSLEEKAAHLLYFIVKNHPFVDGNKRSGAFAFVWFLQKAGLLRASFTPEALTALTLLIAESKPKDKDKMIGLTLLLLKKN